jgi:hypothetical protein
MPDPFVIGVDPASTRLAFVARHPVLPNFATAKYTLGKRFTPACAGEAMDVTLAFLEGVATMTGKSPRTAFVEAPAAGWGKKQNVQSSFKQCFVSGVVQACMIKAGYEVHLVPPASWKQLVVGNGNASKDDVARTVRARWPKLARTIGADLDLADAACLWCYGDTITRRGQLLAVQGIV